jgi:linoleoyl-CoA desaturase
MSQSSIQFAKASPEFFATLSQRVNAYFKSNNLERTANAEMVFKTIFMFSLYFVPYLVLISGQATGIIAQLGLWAIMGFGLAGIGLSIMHDANHGSYSKKQWINNLLGFSLNVIGGHAMNWKVQHNVLHHTYTNIHDVDEDISPRGILRLGPESTWRPIHRYQQFYAWFFYGLMTFVWVFVKDFVRIIKYQKDGLLKKQKTTYAKEWAVLLATKVLYVSYTIVVPMVLLDISFGQVFLGFFLMHYIGGFILAIIFQPAHVIEGTEYPVPDEKGNLENNWAIHQLHTTTNFGRKHRLFSWYVGGLNYQVEHHLFPNVCHVHYREVSKIVEQTAKDFNLPYKSKDTFWKALKAHTRHLRELGEKPKVQMRVSALAA